MQRSPLIIIRGDHPSDDVGFGQKPSPATDVLVSIDWIPAIFRVGGMPNSWPHGWSVGFIRFM